MTDYLGPITQDTATWWRQRLEAAVTVAWMRRNGPSGTVDPFDQMELLEIEDSIEVRPLWAYPRPEGGIRSWSNFPGKNSIPDGWEWRDSNPPEDPWCSDHYEDEWMGEPGGEDYTTEVTWVVEGAHAKPPPVPEHLITYLVQAAEGR